MIGEILGKMFGTDKAAESLITNTSNAIDKIWFTEEEKADAAREDRTEARKMIIEWLNNTQGQNIARRFIALLTTSIWLSQYVIMMVLSVCSVWTDDSGAVTAAKLKVSAEVIGNYANSMDSVMMLIYGFYFAAPYMRSIANVALTKIGIGKQPK